MKTSILLLAGLFLFQSNVSLAQKNKPSSRSSQQETIVIKRSGSGVTTIEVNPNGVYVDGELIAGKNELDNKNLNKKIIIKDGELKNRTYDDYYNSESQNNNGKRRAMLGVYTANNRNDIGAYIQSVTANSAADEAGLRAGDIITQIDTDYIGNAEDLTRTIRNHYAGDKVTISYTRNGRDRQTTATLMEAKEQKGWSNIYNYPEPGWNNTPLPFIPDPLDFYDNKPQLGITVEDLADGRGVHIINTKPNSVAERNGLRDDDVIVAIDGDNIRNVDDLQRILGSLKAGSRIKMELLRDDNHINKTITIPKPKNVKEF